jgi:hypothetical protein
VRERATIILGVTASDVLGFTRALQLFLGVEACGVEEAIQSDFAASISGHQ